MNRAIETAIATMTSAIETAVRERAEYDADPHERAVDREQFRREIDQRRDTAIATAKATLAREFSAIESTYQARRRVDFDEASVASSWGRIERYLDTGRGIDDVLELEGLTRADCQAIRQNYASWLAVQIPEARPQDIERRIRPDLLRVLEREVALMDQAEAGATRDELDRVKAADAVRSVDKMAVEAGASGKISPQSMLEVGYSQRAAGIGPEPEAWETITDRVDPLAAARRARNSASPAVRDAANDGLRGEG
jgi:hypothetical protein